MLIQMLADVPYSVSRIASICDVKPETVRRWFRSEQIPPRYDRLIRLAYTTDHLWPGWRVAGEKLITSEGTAIHRDDIRALPMLLQTVHAMRSELYAFRTAPAQYLIWSD